MFPQLLEQQHPLPDLLQHEVTFLPSPETQQWQLVGQLQCRTLQLDLLEGTFGVKLRGCWLQLEVEAGHFTPSASLPLELTPMAQQGDHRLQWQLNFLSSGKFAASEIRWKWGTVPITPSFQLTFSFQIKPQHLIILNPQRLWSPTLSPTQLAIADRLLAKFLAEKAFPSTLARSCWGMEPLPLLPRPALSFDSGGLSQLSTTLEAQFQIIVESRSLDCQALAQKVSLNPRFDLAGGKFLGVNLSGTDWSGAQLADSNFRGAVLNDIDLSGADVTRGDFRGADLSGAYLEGAKLPGADLRKCSLAVANLIGADLRGADLREATLQQTNFTDADLTNARFGDNPGLGEEQRKWLLARGAKWVSEFDGEMLG